MRRTRERIVELFVARQPFYDLAAVRRLTGATPERLRDAIAERDVDPVWQRGTMVLAWEDVAMLALERSTRREIAHALARAGYAYALPPLNRFHAIALELPLYQIRMLHRLALEAGEESGATWNASDVVERELDAALAGEDAGPIEQDLPGFTAATQFPSFESRPYAVEEACLYCGAPLADRSRTCAACAARHRCTVDAVDARSDLRFFKRKTKVDPGLTLHVCMHVHVC